MKIFNNDESDLIPCRMSQPLWSQMSIVTSFLDYVIIPSNACDPLGLESIHCHRQTWALIVNDVIVPRVPGFFEVLSRTSISLVRTV